jgi:hypothetical protein
MNLGKGRTKEEGWTVKNQIEEKLNEDVVVKLMWGKLGWWFEEKFTMNFELHEFTTNEGEWIHHFELSQFTALKWVNSPLWIGSIHHFELYEFILNSVDSLFTFISIWSQHDLNFSSSKWYKWISPPSNSKSHSILPSTCTTSLRYPTLGFSLIFHTQQKKMFNL